MHAMNARAALPRRDRRITRLEEHGASKGRVRSYLSRCLVWAGIVVAFMGCTARSKLAQCIALRRSWWWIRRGALR